MGEHRFHAGTVKLIGLDMSVQLGKNQYFVDGGFVQFLLSERYINGFQNLLSHVPLA